jgi:hypothetical protein
VGRDNSSIEKGKYIRIVSSAGHTIDIDEKYLIMSNEDFIYLEFNFNWLDHATQCSNCGALYRTIIPQEEEKSVIKMNWYVFMSGRFKLVDFFRFGDSNDESIGHLSHTTRSRNFKEEGKYVKGNEPLEITRIRLILLPFEPGPIEGEKIISEFYGNIRRCEYLNQSLRMN